MMSASTIHLVIPMSGQGVRYQNAGYNMPKPLIPVSGRPMIERLLDNFPQTWTCHFILAKNHQDTALESTLKKIRPNCYIYYVEPHREGPGHALYPALNAIPSDAPVFVSYCDYGMIWDANQFENFIRNTKCDACLVSYRGFHAHYLRPTKYAYSRMEGEQVREVREKGSFTDQRENEYASSGGYYFSSAEKLKSALDFQKRENLSLNGEYYISLTVQALLLSAPKAHVRVFEIPYFFQWGTPEDLEDFAYWERAFCQWNQPTDNKYSVDQIIMPMAGLGSRFQSYSSFPKPLIPIDGKPMYRWALNSLPRTNRITVVTLEEIAVHLLENSVVALQSTPPGQALSTEFGLAQIDLKKEVVVSACDHGIILKQEMWEKFKRNPDCDAAIFTVKGFPGAVRRPNAYSYVAISEENGLFPVVEKISVKQPMTSNPRNEPLLTGTFWFHSGQILKEGIDLLRKKGTLTNGELYLDSVFEVMKSIGQNVRIIPLDGYICWGDPDSMKESLYWQEVFGGRRLQSVVESNAVRRDG